MSIISLMARLDTSKSLEQELTLDTSGHRSYVHAFRVPWLCWIMSSWLEMVPSVFQCPSNLFSVIPGFSLHMQLLRDEFNFLPLVPSIL